MYDDKTDSINIALAVWFTALKNDNSSYHFTSSTSTHEHWKATVRILLTLNHIILARL